LLFQGEIYELVGQVGQGVTFLFHNGVEEIVYYRGELFYQQEPLETILIQQAPAVWETPMGVIECLSVYKQSFLMNTPYTIPPIKAQLEI
jgi:hypothetical protein